MSNTVIFLSGQRNFISLVERIAAIADTVILEDPSAPPKFKLCQEACMAMATFQPVTQEQFMGLVDTVGGYYSSSKLYYEKHSPRDTDAKATLNQAEALLLFVMSLQEKVKGHWKLEVVQ